MGELGGSVTYLYWSTRRTDRYFQDNGIEIPVETNTIGTPGFSFIPPLSRARTRLGNTRAKKASIIEATLGSTAVTNFGGPSPIRYAKGTGTIVFGEFVTWLSDTRGRKPAVMYTMEDYDDTDRDSVGICLFGSMDNFADYIQSTGPGFDGGWVSSSAPYVFEFIRSRGTRIREDFSQGEIAVEALKIANGQGLSPDYTYEYHAIGTDRPWQRAFTYGDVQDVAEWLAEIHLDVDLTQISETGYDRQDGIRRVLIGAPLWVRTPQPAAMRLYGEHRTDEGRRNAVAQRRGTWRRKIRG